MKKPKFEKLERARTERNAERRQTLRDNLRRAMHAYFREVLGDLGFDDIHEWRIDRFVRSIVKSEIVRMDGAQ